MTPDDFIRTWSGNSLSERASAQSHFRGLCALLGVDPPSPLTAGTFEFEKGAAKTTGGDGWAGKGPSKKTASVLDMSAPKSMLKSSTCQPDAP